MCELDSLQPVELRCIWPSEAQDFTPWLAEEEHLALLADTLNMRLELESQEVNVGNFRADLLSRNTEDDSLVLIENQLVQTNHKHLGQILTYAFELNVDTVVWIAKEFRREHRKVFNRLNQIMADDFQFFGVEVKLWKIGDSLPAPKFNIVSSPDISNDLSCATGQGAPRALVGNLTRTQQLQMRFWEAFVEYLADRGSPISPPNPQPRVGMTFSIGRASFTVFVTRPARQLRVQLTIGGENAIAHFHLLAAQREEIEQELCELEWNENPNNISSSIAVSRNDTDLANEEDWPNQHEWLKCKLEKFDEVFRPRLRNLDAAGWQPEDEDDN